MKNKDRAVASILQSLVADTMLELHLAFVHKQDSGPAEGCPGEFSMYEVHESSHTLRDWVKLDGTPAGFREVHIDPDEILQVRGSVNCVASLLVVFVGLFCYMWFTTCVKTFRCLSALPSCVDLDTALKQTVCSLSADVHNALIVTEG